MPIARFTPHLHRYFPALPKEGIYVQGTSVRDVLIDLDRRYRGLADYVVDETGAVRKHVNIFVRNELIRDRLALSDVLSEDDEVFIFQALSGG